MRLIPSVAPLGEFWRNIFLKSGPWMKAEGLSAARSSYAEVGNTAVYSPYYYSEDPEYTGRFFSAERVTSFRCQKWVKSGSKPTTNIFGSTGCPLHGPLQDGYSMLCAVEHSATCPNRLSLWENHNKVVFPEAQVLRLKVDSPLKKCSDTSRETSCHQTIEPCCICLCSKGLHEHA